VGRMVDQHEVPAAGTHRHHRGRRRVDDRHQVCGGHCVRHGIPIATSVDGDAAVRIDDMHRVRLN
jgi:hypothetical protein